MSRIYLLLYNIIIIYLTKNNINIKKDKFLRRDNIKIYLTLSIDINNVNKMIDISLEHKEYKKKK